MRVLNLPSRVQGFALFSALWNIGVLAGPSINVALRASFNSAPYLVELLYGPALFIFKCEIEKIKNQLIDVQRNRR